MTSWKKTSLLTALGTVAILLAIGYLMDVRVSLPSADIEFSPGQPISRIPEAFREEPPENIIVFMADGMGFGHLSLALQTAQSADNPSVWQSFQVKGWHDARSAIGPLTDSEASATAIATGTSTNFGYIGVDSEGNPLESLLELASRKEYATGIVTDSYIWDGTPAAFVAHTTNENDAREILTQIAGSQLDLVFGELEDLGEGSIPDKEETLEILTRRFRLLDRELQLPEDANASQPVAAIFDEDEVQDSNSSPNLNRLTEVALRYLSGQAKPFVLLVESEEMDSASHDNDSDRVVTGFSSIQETLATVLRFAESHGNTLVVFTADHETGGLAALADYDHYPNLQIRWSTKNHTAAVVPFFAYGPGAEAFTRVHRNREIGTLLKSFIADTLRTTVTWK